MYETITTLYFTSKAARSHGIQALKRLAVEASSDPGLRSCYVLEVDESDAVMVTRYDSAEAAEALRAVTRQHIGSAIGTLVRKAPDRLAGEVVPCLATPREHSRRGTS